jgi:hypothetical protein
MDVKKDGKDKEGEILRLLRRMRTSTEHHRREVDFQMVKDREEEEEETSETSMNVDEKRLLRTVEMKEGISLLCRHALIQLLEEGEHVHLLQKVPFEVFLDASKPILIALRKTIEEESQVSADDEDDSDLVDCGKERMWRGFEAIVDRMKGLWEKASGEGWAFLLGQFFSSNEVLAGRYYTLIMWKLIKLIKSSHERGIRTLKLEELRNTFLDESVQLQLIRSSTAHSIIHSSFDHPQLVEDRNTVYHSCSLVICRICFLRFLVFACTGIRISCWRATKSMGS